MAYCDKQQCEESEDCDDIYNEIGLDDSDVE